MRNDTSSGADRRLAGGLIFFPFVLFVLWVLAVSIDMLRGSGAAAS
ncbi:MAG TPA: hypothetical protein VGO38_05460 [Acidimicrobiia bacterium]